jgi:hypothetical protein
MSAVTAGFVRFGGRGQGKNTGLNNEEYEISKLGDLKSQIRNPKYKIAGDLPQPFGLPPYI